METPPRWLMDVWADIGGFPPSRQQWKCESTVNSGMQVGTAVDAAVKAEVPRGAKAEGDWVRPELGVAKEAPGPGVKSELKEAMQRPQLPQEAPEPGVKEAPQPGVRSELKEALERRVKSKLASATAGGKRWYCGACGKYIACSNRAKHVKRIHPRAITVKRGRPKGDGKRIRRKGTRLERDAYEGIDIS